MEQLKKIDSNNWLLNFNKYKKFGNIFSGHNTIMPEINNKKFSFGNLKYTSVQFIS